MDSLSAVTLPVGPRSDVAADLRALMRNLAQPVVVVTGRDQQGRPRGMTISSFTSVSLAPALVLFCPSRRSGTWRAIAPIGRFAINVLAADQADVAARFAQPGGAYPRTRLSASTTRGPRSSSTRSPSPSARRPPSMPAATTRWS